MNSCILMAEIIQDPQLRYTSDTQTAITEMVVQFPGTRPEDPPATLKVVGWGNLAQEIQERYHQGDRVVIEGRLSMNTVDRPEGFKEKRAELTAQRIHTLGAGASFESTVTASPGLSSQPASLPEDMTPPPKSSASRPAAKAAAAKVPTPAPAAEPDFDDIPF